MSAEVTNYCMTAVDQSTLSCEHLMLNRVMTWARGEQEETI